MLGRPKMLPTPGGGLKKKRDLVLQRDLSIFLVMDYRLRNRLLHSSRIAYFISLLWLFHLHSFKRFSLPKRRSSLKIMPNALFLSASNLSLFDLERRL